MLTRIRDHRRDKRRRYGTSGLIGLSFDWMTFDAALEISYGGPGENHLTLRVYNADKAKVGTVTTTLRHRDAVAVSDALASAQHISRALGQP
ncbi:hypothetical protein [Nocardia sp. NPDC058497]|uniref:hypothetical protein n=1 Tax=Nocardia sp. NPDC058497 TaxID=3346529 RepID=UPI003654C128